MTIPDFQTLMRPIVQLASDGQEHSNQAALDQIASLFGLSEEDLRAQLPSGSPVFNNRYHWARTHLKQAGLITYPRRGTYQITQRGQTALAERPQRIDMHYLRHFPEYIEFTRPRPSVNGSSGAHPPVVEPLPPDERKTPEELIAEGAAALRQDLAQELLAKVLECSPTFFEGLVVELLVKMGYGGSRVDAGKRVGRSGDSGIDGLINEDRLGLDVVYLQAKRWADKPVGRPDIQQFVGALQGQRARKGVYITTSTFSEEARRYADNIESKIVLIDGQRLAELMIDFDVGVATVSTYQVKRMDSDYFNDEA